MSEETFTPVKTLEESWEIIKDLNEVAHSSVITSWQRVEKLEAEGSDEVEDARAEAKVNQQAEFREKFGSISDSELRLTIQHWATNDDEFGSQFSDWYGHY